MSDSSANESCLELTILMPCLNEAETLGVCIDKAHGYLKNSGVTGEVLIADNGSTDGSREIAREKGARVEPVDTRGYGAALLGGIQAARGKFIIMGDADDSYDFENLQPFVDQLRQGKDLVMGNRFSGGISKGAMPFLHRYLGNPVLSFIGKLFFKSDIGDFHCGLRGFNAESIRKLGLQTTGMEFASEMVVKSSLFGYKIAEVPTTLKPDGRSRPPHLNTWRDGWRHLKFLLMHNPRWLFVYPGLCLLFLSVLLMVATFSGPLRLTGSIELDVHTFLFACFSMVAAVQMVSFGVLTRVYASRTKYLPTSSTSNWLVKNITPDAVIVASAVMFFIGLGLFGYISLFWIFMGFGDLSDYIYARITAMGLTFVTVGVQLFFSGFVLGILDIPVTQQGKESPK